MNDLVKDISNLSELLRYDLDENEILFLKDIDKKYFHSLDIVQNLEIKNIENRCLKEFKQFLTNIILYNNCPKEIMPYKIIPGNGITIKGKLSGKNSAFTTEEQFNMFPKNTKYLLDFRTTFPDSYSRIVGGYIPSNNDKCLSKGYTNSTIDLNTYNNVYLIHYKNLNFDIRQLWYLIHDNSIIDINEKLFSSLPLIHKYIYNVFDIDIKLDNQPRFVETMSRLKQNKILRQFLESNKFKNKIPSKQFDLNQVTTEWITYIMSFYLTGTELELDFDKYIMINGKYISSKNKKDDMYQERLKLISYMLTTLLKPIDKSHPGVFKHLGIEFDTELSIFSESFSSRLSRIRNELNSLYTKDPSLKYLIEDFERDLNSRNLNLEKYENYIKKLNKDKKKLSSILDRIQEKYFNYIKANKNLKDMFSSFKDKIENDEVTEDELLKFEKKVRNDYNNTKDKLEKLKDKVEDMNNFIVTPDYRNLLENYVQEYKTILDQLDIDGFPYLQDRIKIEDKSDLISVKKNLENSIKSFIYSFKIAGNIEKYKSDLITIRNDISNLEDNDKLKFKKYLENYSNILKESGGFNEFYDIISKLDYYYPNVINDKKDYKDIQDDVINSITKIIKKIIRSGNNITVDKNLKDLDGSNYLVFNKKLDDEDIDYLRTRYDNENLFIDPKKIENIEFLGYIFYVIDDYYSNVKFPSKELSEVQSMFWDGIEYERYMKLSKNTRIILEELFYILCLFDHKQTTYCLPLKDISDDMSINNICFLPKFKDKDTYFTLFKNMKLKYEESQKRKKDYQSIPPLKTISGINLNKTGTNKFFKSLKNCKSPFDVVALYNKLYDQYKSDQNNIIETDNDSIVHNFNTLAIKAGFDVKLDFEIDENEKYLVTEIEPNFNLSSFKNNVIEDLKEKKYSLKNSDKIDKTINKFKDFITDFQKNNISFIHGGKEKDVIVSRLPYDFSLKLNDIDIERFEKTKDVSELYNFDLFKQNNEFRDYLMKLFLNDKLTEENIVKILPLNLHHKINVYKNIVSGNNERDEFDCLIELFKKEKEQEVCYPFSEDLFKNIPKKVTNTDLEYLLDEMIRIINMSSVINKPDPVVCNFMKIINELDSKKLNGIELDENSKNIILEILSEKYKIDAVIYNHFVILSLAINLAKLFNSKNTKNKKFNIDCEKLKKLYMLIKDKLEKKRNVESKVLNIFIRNLANKIGIQYDDKIDLLEYTNRYFKECDSTSDDDSKKKNNNDDDNSKKNNDISDTNGVFDKTC